MTIEPWQLTRDEFAKTFQISRLNVGTPYEQVLVFGGSEGKTRWQYEKSMLGRGTDEEVLQEAQKRYIQQALSEGKSVPSSVLADYPDLASMAPALIYGRLAPPLLEELKRMVDAAEWPPPEEPSPAFSAVLQVCDYAFPLNVLKRKCDELLVRKSGHKKILAARLLLAKEEEVTALAERTIAELKARGIENDLDMTLEEVTEIARKVMGI